MKKELEDRLVAATRASWPAVIADMDSLTETEVEQDGKRFLLRSAPRPPVPFMCGFQASSRYSREV
jgi:hypothetical protein